MPGNYTPKYKLNQWKKTDKVLMEDFNADNAKIDEGLGALAKQVDQKADKTALTQETTARTSAVNSINTALAKTGNCEIQYTTYTGNGKSGSSYPNKVTFSKTPLLVMVHAPDGTMLFISSKSGNATSTNHNAGNLPVSWSGATVSWYSNTSYEYQLNSNGTKYHVFSLYKTN